MERLLNWAGKVAVRAGRGGRQGVHRADDALERRLRQLYRFPYEPTWQGEVDRRLRPRLISSAEALSVRRRPHFRPWAWTLRPVTAILAVALLAALAAGAYAAVSLVNRALLSMPGTSQIVLSNLGRQVNLTRGRCGFTVTVNRVYADEHDLVVGYSFSAPSGSRLSPGVASQPGELPEIVAPGGAPFYFLEIAGPAEAVNGNSAAQFATFDDRAAAVGRSVLHARLTFPAINVTERARGPIAIRDCPGYSESPTNTPGYRAVQIPGPFAFDLTVPVTHDLRAARLNLVAEKNRVTARLTRVEVTPIDVWATLTVTGAVQGTPPVEIAIPDGVPRPQNASAPFMQVHDRHAFYEGVFIGVHTVRFGLAMYNYHGEWTIRLYTRTGLGPPTGPYHVRRQWVSDPVTFQFHTP